jgi:hypothetical protein
MKIKIVGENRIKDYIPIISNDGDVLIICEGHFDPTSDYFILGEAINAQRDRALDFDTATYSFEHWIPVTPDLWIAGTKDNQKSRAVTVIEVDE